MLSKKFEGIFYYLEKLYRKGHIKMLLLYYISIGFLNKNYKNLNYVCLQRYAAFLFFLSFIDTEGIKIYNNK